MSKENLKGFSIEIPLDASGVEGFKPDKDIKVLVKDSKGNISSQTAKPDAKGKSSATFDFDKHPGPLHVVVGPGDATDQELLGLQTITVNIPGRLWLDKNKFQLTPIIITPYYWWWWWRWCQTFTINGRVVCADGSPVPGATVCAYDVDWWWLWSSTEQVGCAVTDINGVFQVRFRWCCGWWPWWWWRNRIWLQNPILSGRISEVLKQVPDLKLSSQTSNQPGLSVFKDMLTEHGISVHKPLTAVDVDKLEGVRGLLLKKLPASTELAQLRIWPWWPWWPWNDCNPDIIFRVTQDCGGKQGTVIVDEGVGDTRWNIPNTLNVTLNANELACCVPHCQQPPCDEGECMVITRVCNDPIDGIYGNLDAIPPPQPAQTGYCIAGDRPYGADVKVFRNYGDTINLDYYELEVFNGGVWTPLPAGGSKGFGRNWFSTVAPHNGNKDFPVTIKNDLSALPHFVTETREHYEITGGLSGWGITRVWLDDRDLLAILDSSKFADGTYRFRVIGWQENGLGQLINRRVIQVCGERGLDNNLVLTFDNQIMDPLSHDSTHHCGLGVHACTQEPDTHIIAVRVNGVQVDPCGTSNAQGGDVEIDFMVNDPDAHLSHYTLVATYGLSGVVDLLAGATSVTGGSETGWAPGANAGTYAKALTQGAVAPHWSGGAYTLRIPFHLAFPIHCCYQLELRAYKRTIVSCYYGYAHNNLTEYSIGIGICS